ncbi:hypothetical protein LTR67_007329 [Exophiala xenobiotica]
MLACHQEAVRAVTFVDETQNTEDSYVSPPWSPESSPRRSPSPVTTSSFPVSDGAVLGLNGPELELEVPEVAALPIHLDANLPIDIVSPDEALRGASVRHLLPHDRTVGLGTRGQNDLGLETEAEVPGFRMKICDHTEALLMRHYIDNLACWLDVCDVSRTFQTVVPDLAIQHPILLNALLAFSARHLSRISDYDPEAADGYHQKSVELLIPGLEFNLQEGRVGADETLLIATIFLRLYEQMNSSVYGVDFKQHLSGSAAIVNAQAHRELVQASGVTGNFLSTLHEASFWSFLRQDIDMALANQKKPKVELSLCRITWDSDASDTTWAKWMIWIVAETAALCFGGETNDVEGASALGRVVLRERWAEMKEKCARWWWSKPNGFLPLYYQKRDVAAGRWFPEIWLGSPWHITGIQYYHAAMVLLAIYDPFRLKPGRDYMRIHRELQREVLHHAREMVGVCFGKRADVPARLTLTHAIVACGSWFVEPMEQDLLLDLLREHQTMNGWPTDKVVANLLVDWGRLE